MAAGEVLAWLVVVFGAWVALGAALPPQEDDERVFLAGWLIGFGAALATMVLAGAP